MVVGVLVVELDDVVVDVLNGALDLHPRDAELLELHQSHRPGRVLEQRLIDPQRDRGAGVELAVGEVLGEDLRGEVGGDICSPPHGPRESIYSSRPYLIFDARWRSARGGGPSQCGRRRCVIERLEHQERTDRRRGLEQRSSSARRGRRPAASEIASISALRPRPQVCGAGLGPWWSCLRKQRPATEPSSRRSISASSPNRFARPQPKHSSWWTSAPRAAAGAHFSRNALIRTSYDCASRE